MGEAVPDRLREQVAELLRGQWWVRALLLTEADPVLGLVLRAATAKPTLSPPWFGPSAIIDDKGIVLTNTVDAQNKRHFATAICHIDDLVSNLRQLCDWLQLPDAHAHALFAMVRQWIVSDARPETEQAEDRVPIEYRRLN